MIVYTRTGFEKEISKCLPICDRSFLKTAKTVFLMLNHWSQRREERKQLNGLNERLLKDIGITRYDAEHEVAKPFWRE